MRSPILILWCAVIALGTLAFFLSAKDYSVEHVHLSETEPPLWVALFTPTPAPATPMPAAIICQPLNNSPRSVQPFAAELTREGYTVLAFDWRGRTPAENRQRFTADLPSILKQDGVAAVQYLQSRPDIDPQRIVICGHSVGGNMAINVALDQPDLAATACIGMETSVPEDAPRNLLWAAGLYDEFRPPTAMQRAFAASASLENLPPDLTQVGNFDNGTARGLAISPASDHLTEMVDRRLQRRVMDWFNRAVGLPPVQRPFHQEWACRAYAMAWLLALAAAAATARAGLRGRPAALRLLPALGFLLLLLAHGIAARAPGLAANLTVWTVIAVPLATYSVRLAPHAAAPAARKTARILCTLWFVLTATLLLNRAPWFLHRPGDLLHFPEFSLTYPLNWTYLYPMVHMSQVLTKTCAADHFRINAVGPLVLVLEGIRPGMLLAIPPAIVQRIETARSTRERARTTFPLPAVGALVVLLLVLAYILWIRLGQGFVTRESLTEAGIFILRYGLIPATVYAALRRVQHRIRVTHR